MSETVDVYYGANVQYLDAAGVWHYIYAHSPYPVPASRVQEFSKLAFFLRAETPIAKLKSRAS